MPRWLIAVDLDSTATVPGGLTLVPELQEAFQELEKNGHCVVPSTGRPYRTTHSVFRRVPITAAVCGNGSATYWPKEQVIVTRDFVSARKAVEETIEFARKQGTFAIYTAYGDGETTPIKVAYHERPVPTETLHRLQAMRIRPPILTQVPDVLGVPYTASRLALFPGLEKSQEVYEELRERLAPTGCVVYIYPREGVVEVLSPGCTKAMALEQVRHRLGIPRENVLACGDSYNDLEMLLWAGVPVVMGHGAPDLQLLGDHVIGRWENGLGLARFLQRFFRLR